MNIIKSLANEVFSHTLFRGSLVMFIGTTIVNVGNYFFHLLMGRSLGPSGYGILESMISSLYLMSIISATLSLVIVRYVSQAQGRGDVEAVALFYHWLKKRLIILGVIVSLVLTVFLHSWSSFLKIYDLRIFYLTVLGFILSFWAMSLRSFLQGTLNFFGFNVSTVFETAVKILLSVFFVYLGWSVFGVFVGIFLSGLVGMTMAYFFLHLKKTTIKDFTFSGQKELLRYGIPVLISTIGYTSLFSTDIILVKHYFSSFDAGIYAALSILGKIIFFASGSIAAVMFPLISQKHAKGEHFQKIFWMSFLLVGISSAILSSIYYFFPDIMLQMLYGSSYLAGKNLLFSFAVFISLYSLGNVLMYFFLSIGKTKAVIFPLICAGLQILFIMIWHQNLQIVLTDSVIATSILLAGLLIYYPYAAKK